MKQSHKLLLQWGIIVAACISIVVITVNLNKEKNAVELVYLNDTFPTLTLQDLTGKTQDLIAEQGKPMLVNLWATWCKPCVNELPLLNEVQQFVPEVTVVAVNMGETATEVEPFRERYDLTMPILMDKDLILKQMFQAAGYPLSIFVDGNGKVVSIHSGEITDFNELLKDMKALVVEG